MKKILSASVAALALATAGVAAPASAELSANAGYLTDYYFRGVSYGDGGAYVGADYDISGFFVGTWIIDDSPVDENGGLETDVYLGYGMEHGENFAWKVAYNRYEYTYAASYEEELDAAFDLPMGFAVEVARGYANDKESDPDIETGYRYVAASWSNEVVGVLLGSHDNIDADDKSSYYHAEVNAGGEVAGFDIGVTAGVNFKARNELNDKVTGNEGYIFLDISKTFTDFSKVFSVK